MDDVFVDFDGKLEYSTDGKLQLKPESPAYGAGIGGVDCGAFGIFGLFLTVPCNFNIAALNISYLCVV